MSGPLAPTPEEIADSAVAAASKALDSVKAFTTGIASDRIHAASLRLHEAGSASTAGPSDEETWIRQAAMMLLVGVQALSDDEGTAVDDDNDECDDDAAIEEACRLLAQGRLAEAEALADVLLERADALEPEDAGDLVHHGHLIQWSCQASPRRRSSSRRTPPFGRRPNRISDARFVRAKHVLGPGTASPR